MSRSKYISEIPIHNFHGGIHPVEHKAESNQIPIRDFPLAKELVLNLKGQAGKTSLPIVSVGDYVFKGQVIAESDGIFSAFLHAPTSGTVTAIEPRPIAHTSGLPDNCIVIEADGEDAWCELSPLKNYQEQPREKILEHIFHSGIVGLGGASFPSHIKLQKDTGIHTLIVNAAECEPYITCDDRLMQDASEKILEGALMIASLFDSINIIVGIEDNKPGAIEALMQARNQLTTNLSEQIKIAVVPTKYPSGGKKQLTELLTGKQVAKGERSANSGIVMHNIGTCYAVYEAIALGKPLIERVTTLTGESCQNKGNFRIPFGTPIRHILETSGAPLDAQVIMGGPLMGIELTNFDAGIVKATNCLIMAGTNELGQNNHEMPCIRCGECMDACPASLLPQQLYWYAKADNFDKTEEYNLFDCIECGACAYVCPSNIPLVQYYRYAKSNIRNNRLDKAKSDKARERHEARLDRLERVKKEKAEKHRRAAEARKKAAEAKGEADAKKAAVAAALARVQKKKEQSSAESKESFDSKPQAEK